MSKREIQTQALIPWEMIEDDFMAPMIALGEDDALTIEPLAVAYDEKIGQSVVCYALQTHYVRGIVPVTGLIVVPQALGCGHITCSRPLDICLN